MTDAITIRPATFADRPEIERLAALDDGHATADDFLLAFVGGELRAALPSTGERPLADPFHLTGEVVSLLRFWAARRELIGDYSRPTARRCFIVSRFSSLSGRLNAY